VKACVAGYGHADKKQVQQMVRTLLGMKETPEPSDAADALAVALCYIQAEKLERRFGIERALAGKTARASGRPAASAGRGVVSRGPIVQ